MNEVTMYTVPVCPYCKKAEELLSQLGIQQIHKIDVAGDSTQLAAMLALTKQRTVPQIFIGATYVGGYDQLRALHEAGTLVELLATAQPVSE